MSGGAFGGRRRLRSLEGEDDLVKRHGLWVWTNPQLPMQRIPKPFELAHRRLAIARVQMGSHEFSMRCFIGGVRVDHALPHPGSSKGLHVKALKPSSWLLRPLRVRVFREEITGVQARGPRCLTSVVAPKSFRRCPLENLGIDHEVDARAELEDASGHPDGPFPSERSAGEMNGLPEVRRAGLRGEVGPQCFDQFVAVELVSRRHSQDLHQLGASAMAPCIGGQYLTIDLDPKGAEQGDPARPHAFTL
jgi:hypothetical protein